MTEERAEKECRAKLGAEDGVQGKVVVGVGSSGPSAGIGIKINNRILDPQTPEEFLAECIDVKMGRKNASPEFGIRVGAST